MDLNEKSMAPSALYGGAMIGADTFRSQKTRGSYEPLGIVSTGKVSSYSVADIAAVAIVNKLTSGSVELQDAVRIVAKMTPRFAEIVERGRAEAARFNDDLAKVEDITPGWKVYPFQSFSMLFCLTKGENGWIVAELRDWSGLVERAAVAQLGVFIDVGRILGDVIGRLVRGGALRSDEI